MEFLANNDIESLTQMPWSANARPTNRGPGVSSAKNPSTSVSSGWQSPLRVDPRLELTAGSQANLDPSMKSQLLAEQHNTVSRLSQGLNYGTTPSINAHVEWQGRRSPASASSTLNSNSAGQSTQGRRSNMLPVVVTPSNTVRGAAGNVRPASSGPLVLRPGSPVRRSGGRRPAAPRRARTRRSMRVTLTGCCSAASA